MSSRTHLGVRFDVWNGQQGWFWLVVNARRDAGVVGAAAKEADAVREACSSIEEMSSKPPVAKSLSNLS
jgi:hypothetical protein